MDQQQAMVRLIRRRGIQDPRVLAAMAEVPRHAFVPEDQRELAYANGALPIAAGQTISQPYIVAWMSEALALQPGDRVLELGTGSGYQAAVLAAMGMEVYTVERIGTLYETACTRLATLDYTVQCKLGDGFAGWPEFAPYRGIIITAAPAQVPAPLWEQLAAGGRLVAPLGLPYGIQMLWTFIKHGEEIERVAMGMVRFVPFLREEQAV